MQIIENPFRAERQLDKSTVSTGTSTAHDQKPYNIPCQKSVIFAVIVTVIMVVAIIATVRVGVIIIAVVFAAMIVAARNRG